MIYPIRPAGRLLNGLGKIMICLAAFAAPGQQAAAKELRMEPVKSSRFRLGGVIGARLRANENNWLLRAPAANPGMLGMFAVRDDGSQHDLVPWAGEFIGKYLISAIQALRFSDSPTLRNQTAELVARTISCQALDGYLGPFPRSTRLKANWDLWGHYHALQALLLWHDETGDSASLAAATRIGDLICNTFLNTGLRIRDAGSAEMNMAVIHGLGLLYMHTHNARYLAMMRQIEIDWEAAGNYLRTGIEGVPFYSTPHPRWESLHDIQGLAVLYRITGDRRYLQALESHWRSILRWDVHNTGAFSTSEGAIGDQYTAGAIETCCTVAWMALSVDYLELTGDPRAADALEIALYNAIAGAQHSTGEWCTYDTPMNGTRIPSYAAIAFQARPDTPELNCCSVNAPRGLSMLADWAVMRSGKGLAVNYYGPGTMEVTLSDNTAVKIESDTDYPLDKRIKLTLSLERPVRFPLLLRIPGWSRKTTVHVKGGSDTDYGNAKPGTYLTIDREWKTGDSVLLDLDMKLRVVPGDRAALGKVSVYHGPLLLAFDAVNNAGPADNLPTLTLKSLNAAHIITAGDSTSAVPAPWMTASVHTSTGTDAVLCDFASAGSTGSTYHSWINAAGAALPTPSLQLPDDGSMVLRDRIVLTWSAPPPDVHELSYHVVVSESADLSAPIIDRRCLNGTTYHIKGAELKRLRPLEFYYWCVTIEGRRAAVGDAKFPARFKIAP